MSQSSRFFDVFGTRGIVPLASRVCAALSFEVCPWPVSGAAERIFCRWSPIHVLGFFRVQGLNSLKWSLSIWFGWETPVPHISRHWYPTCSFGIQFFQLLYCVGSLKILKFVGDHGIGSIPIPQTIPTQSFPLADPLFFEFVRLLHLWVDLSCWVVLDVWCPLLCLVSTCLPWGVCCDLLLSSLLLFCHVLSSEALNNELAARKEEADRCLRPRSWDTQRWVERWFWSEAETVDFKAT